MHHLDFERRTNGTLLTYALIELKDNDKKDSVESALNVWQGARDHPYYEFLL